MTRPTTSALLGLLQAERERNDRLLGMVERLTDQLVQLKLQGAQPAVAPRKPVEREPDDETTLVRRAEAKALHREFIESASRDFERQGHNAELARREAERLLRQELDEHPAGG